MKVASSPNSTNESQNQKNCPQSKAQAMRMCVYVHTRYEQSAAGDIRTTQYLIKIKTKKLKKMKKRTTH